MDSGADGYYVRTDWWHPAWIPISYSGSGDHHCIDLAPGPGGITGQVIEMWHDDRSHAVVAARFTDMLAALADGLEAGDYVFSEDYNALVRKEDTKPMN